MKPAILLIDVLEDFFQEGRLKENRSTLVKNINALTSVGRVLHIPIIWVRQAFKADLSDAFLGMRKTHTPITIENTAGSQLLTELERGPADIEVIKKRYSAFFRTTLDDVLQRLGIDTLIIGGINTHACVRMAVIDAYQRDYEVLLAVDCTDSYDEEHHRISLRYLTRTMSIAKTNVEIFELLSLLEEDMNDYNNSSDKQLTHLDESGSVHMVDVTERPETLREAVAKVRVRMAAETVRLIETNQVSKGSVVEVAKIAGIIAAKQTSQLIPLCHPLPMTHVDLRFTLDSVEGLIHIEARTRTTYRTGVDVEALTAATVAALTIYDMCKGVDTTITIEQAYVALKSGGKSGTVEFQPG